MARRVIPGTGGYFRRKAILFLFLGIVFVMGAAAGTLAVRTLPDGQKNDLMNYLQGFFQTFRSNPSPNSDAIFKQSIVDNIGKTVGVIWILGLSIIGIPLVIAVLFLRGFVIGFSVGFLVDQMVYKGVALAAVAIAPHNLLIIPSVLLAAGASLSFSGAALKTLFGQRSYNMYQQFLSTTLLCLLACLGLVAAAFVEGFVTPTLMELAGRYIF